MVLVRTWFSEHPPSVWIRFLEVSLKALNWILLVLGLAVAAWSVVTVVQIQNEPITPPSPPPPPSAPALTSHSQATPSLLQQTPFAAPQQQLQLAGSISNVPLFIYAFGALGLATTLTSATALLGIRLRSPGCMSSHIFLMCLLLTGQACAAVAFFMDKAWQKRLPDIDEKLKEFLVERLQVCKWLGVGLLCLQLLELMLGCGLQGAYVGAEEAAEDADEEAAWRRRPLLQAQAARQGTSLGATTVPAADMASADDPDGWRERMQQQYGLDTSQFTYRPGGAVGQAGSSRGQQGQRGRGCSIM